MFKRYIRIPRLAYEAVRSAWSTRKVAPEPTSDVTEAPGASSAA